MAELVSRMRFPSRHVAKSAIFEYLGPSTTPADCTRHWATGAKLISRRVEWETLRSHEVNVPVLSGEFQTQSAQQCRVRLRRRSLRFIY
jgi:hypothetical protein